MNITVYLLLDIWALSSFLAITNILVHHGYVSRRGILGQMQDSVHFSLQCISLVAPTFSRVASPCLACRVCCGGHRGSSGLEGWRCYGWGQGLPWLSRTPALPASLLGTAPATHLPHLNEGSSQPPASLSLPQPPSVGSPSCVSGPCHFLAFRDPLALRTEPQVSKAC